MKEKTMRKVLSVLLVLVMVIGMLPVTGPTALVKAEEVTDITGGNNEEGGDITGTPTPAPVESSNEETGEDAGITPAPASGNEGKEDTGNTPAPSPSTEEGTKEDADNTPTPSSSSEEGTKEDAGNTPAPASNDEKKEDTSNTPASNDVKKDDTSNTPAPTSSGEVKKDDNTAPADNPAEVPESKTKSTDDKNKKAVTGTEQNAGPKTDRNTQKVKDSVSDNNAKNTDAATGKKVTEEDKKTKAVEKVPNKLDKKETAEAGKYPEFKGVKTVDGVTVTVSAEEGTFPEGTKLSVTKVSAVKEVKEAVEEERGKEVNVAASYTFDIKLLDKDGKEIQPADGKKVNVSFKLAEVADKNLNTEVYHLSEEGDDYTAEELSVSEKGTEAIVETTGFSYYTVEFTYDTLQYVMNGDTSIPLSTILKEVGLSGEVTDVKVSDDSLFAASKETGEWIVTALKAFSTEEWMKVTINGFEYEIVVTDDLQPEVKYLDESGNEQTCTNYTVVTAETTQWAGGWYVVSENVEITNEVVCNGEVHLILCDGKTLNAGKGIHSDFIFTIYAQSKDANKGKLIATGSNETNKTDGIFANNVTINGGDITASSNDTSAICANLDLTINGGKVTASGNHGLYAGNGSVKINGGTVDVTGTSEGIYVNNNGNTIINGGTVTVRGDNKAIDGKKNNNIMNNIAGTGWTDKAGTGDGTPIPVETEGQSLSYRKVIFPTYAEYPLKVGGKQVTSVNASDVFGDGTVCYDATNHKLTLNGYEYKGSGIGVYYYPDNNVTDEIEIELVGKNKVEAAADGFDVKNATFTGGGSLNITTARDDQSGICDRGRGSGLVLNSNITVTGGWGIYSDGGLTISGGEIKATGKSHPGIQINNNNYLVIKKGTLVATGNNKAIEGNVKNSMAGTGWTDTAGTEGKADIDISEAGQTIESKYKKVMFPAYAEYPIWVSETQITSNTLSGGGWSYNPETNTLTFENYNFDGPGKAKPTDSTVIFNESKSGTFIIELKGSNTITQRGKSDNNVKYGIYSKSDLVIKGSGTLDIKTTDDAYRGAAIYGEENVTILGGTTVNATSGTVTGIKEGYGIGSGGASSTLTIGSGANVTMTGPKGGTNLTVKNDDPGTAWTDTAGTQGKKNIPVSETGQPIDSKYKKVMFPAHVHDFTYSASDATITAKCANKDGKCDLPDCEVTLTIVKPEITTYGETGEGIEKATFDADELAAFNDATSQSISADSIKYVGRNGTEYEGTTAPKYAGDYTASITLEDVKTEAGEGKSVTASVDYTIAQADPNPDVPTDLTATYGQTLADVTLPEDENGKWSWKDSTTDVGNVGTHSFTAVYTPNDKKNYKTVERSVAVNVGKADNPANVAASAEVKVGGNTVDLTDNVTLNDAKGPVSYAIEGDVKGCSLSGSVLTSGDSTGFVTVKVTIAEDDNYKELVTSITVTLTDKDTQTITVEDVTVEDGEKGRKVSATTSGDGKISYAVKEGSEDYIEVDPLTGELTVKKVPENGKAYVTVIAEETKEYARATKDVTISIVVPKHEPKIEESSGDSVLPSPDALDIIYKENGVRVMSAAAVKQIQGPAAQYAFRRLLIPGCKEAFTFNLMVDGRNVDYDLKHGKVILFIPDAYRKNRRIFALLVIDKNGRVHFCPDTDFDPAKITVDLFAEGYAFDLIYVDAD